MVSLFSQQQGIVVATAIMENKKESEICVIQQLLSQLKLENHVIIKAWVLSIFRMHGFDSIKAAIDQISHNIPAMASLLM